MAAVNVLYGMHSEDRDRHVRLDVIRSNSIKMAVFESVGGNVEIELTTTACEITIRVHIRPCTVCLTKDKLACNEHLSTQSEVIQKLILQNHLLAQTKHKW
jgi:hypothetical protein